MRDGALPRCSRLHRLEQGLQVRRHLALCRRSRRGGAAMGDPPRRRRRRLLLLLLLPVLLHEQLQEGVVVDQRAQLRLQLRLERRGVGRRRRDRRRRLGLGRRRLGLLGRLGLGGRGGRRFARGAFDLPAAIDAALRSRAWAPFVARCGPCVLPNVKSSKAGSSNGMP